MNWNCHFFLIHFKSIDEFSKLLFWLSLILKIDIDKAGDAKPESSSLVITIFEAGTHFYPEDPEKIIQWIANFPIMGGILGFEVIEKYIFSHTWKPQHR